MESLKWCNRIKNGGARDWFSQSPNISFKNELTKLAYHELAKELFINGYVVFPIYSKQECKELIKEFKQTELDFREYNSDIKLGTKENPYVLGGFGAYGNASSFHNMFVRKIRAKKMQHIPIFGELMNIAEKNGIIKDAKKYKVAQLMDRMCKRITNTTTTKESYHTDLLPKGRNTDFTIGGWIQLSKDTSYFSCVPKTHTFFPKKSNKGFATQKKDCTHNIPVAQGHILMFFQNLGHCVYSIKRKTDSYRLFSVYLLTTHNTHIYNYEKIIEENGIPRLASNQLPWLYGPNHGSFWLEKITIPWSLRVFKKELLIEKTKKNGTKYKIVESPMKSLKHYGLKLYPPYQEWEKNLFIPAQEFQLQNELKIKMFL
jgi:hypothetical protein